MCEKKNNLIFISIQLSEMHGTSRVKSISKFQFYLELSENYRIKIQKKEYTTFQSILLVNRFYLEFSD